MSDLFVKTFFLTLCFSVTIAEWKSSLGDNIYCLITAEQFSTDCFLDCLDLSSEYHTLDVANRIEAAVYVWKQKDQSKHRNT